MISKDLPGWLTQEEIMEITGLKETTLWKLRSEGKLRHSKLGRKVYYDGNSIITLLDENSTE